MVKNITRVNVETCLLEAGFQAKDFLDPIINPLIKEYHSDTRTRIYTPSTVVSMMTASVLSRDQSLNSAVISNNAYRLSQGLDVASTNTGSYSNARERLNKNLLIDGVKQSAANVEAQVPSTEFWKGLKPFGIDGSTLTANDTLENQKEFPQHASQDEGTGFPLIRVMILQSLSTGMIFSAAYGPFKGKETGEMALAREILPDLMVENSLLIGDRYFPSYFTMAELMEHGIHGLFQMHAARDFDLHKGEQLGILDHIATWEKPRKPSWMTQEEYEKYPSHINVRETDLSKNIANENGFIVVTTLLDSMVFTKSKLTKFYKKRWKIETAYKDLKTTFEMEHIAANSPKMIEKIIWTHFLSYNILRWHILNAAILYQTNIDKVSIKTASTVLIKNSLTIEKASKEDIPRIFSYVYLQFIQVPVDKRPGRSEPRAVKKRPKPFPRLKMKRSVYHASIIP